MLAKKQKSGSDVGQFKYGLVGPKQVGGLSAPRVDNLGITQGTTSLAPTKIESVNEPSVASRSKGSAAHRGGDAPGGTSSSAGASQKRIGNYLIQ